MITILLHEFGVDTFVFDVGVFKMQMIFSTASRAGDYGVLLQCGSLVETSLKRSLQELYLACGQQTRWSAQEEDLVVANHRFSRSCVWLMEKLGKSIKAMVVSTESATHDTENAS